MKTLIIQLNYLVVLATAIAGFLLGWLWYSPVLFAKSWMAEMRITEEMMKAAAEKGMARFFALGFVYTAFSTFTLAILVVARGADTWMAGAKFGFFLGLFLVGARMLNGSLWEQRSLKLQAINLGHELALFTLQGAILAVWH